jgi:uncharacterized protein
MDVLSQKPQSIFHVFKWKDSFLLFDLSTHSLFQTDAEVWQDYQQNEWTATLKQVLSDGRNEGFFNSRQDPHLFEDHRCFKSLCFMVTRACNFRCKYCFEASQPLENSNAGSMTLETAKKAIDWLILQAKDRKQLEIDFFGGEPLLDFPLIKEAVLYARSREKASGKHFLMSITSNAYLLTDQITDFFQKHHISIILSLDGSQEVNDLFRVDSHGRGTYDRSIRNILNTIPKLSTGYYVRGTYTHQSLRFASEVKHLYSLGIKQISFEPVASLMPGIAIQESDLLLIQKEYEKLSEWMLFQSKTDPDLHFYHFEIDLEKSICIEKLYSGCGAGVEYLSLSPEGKLYPCHQFDGRQDYCFGSPGNEALRKDLQDSFRKSTLLHSRPECCECWAKTLCGGGCIANNLFIEGNMDKPYDIGCKIQKIRLEAALYYQACKKNS